MAGQLMEKQLVKEVVWEQFLRSKRNLGAERIKEELRKKPDTKLKKKCKLDRRSPPDFTLLLALLASGCYWRR